MSRKRRNSQTAEAAHTAGAKVPDSNGFMIPMKRYNTSFGTIHYPAYIEFGVLEDLGDLPGQRMVTEILKRTLSEKDIAIARRLPLDTVDGVNGSAIGLFEAMMGGMPGESEAS